MPNKRFLSFLFFSFAMEVFALGFTEAIKTTLLNNPDIRLQKENIENYKGLNVSQEGTFDTRLSASITAGEEHIQNSAYSDQGVATNKPLSYTVQFDKQFENTLSLQSGINYTENNSDSNNINLISNFTKVYFSINKPLLRGNDRSVVTANKSLSELDLQISNCIYRRQINTSIYNVAAAYWSHLLANKTYQYTIQAKAMAQSLLDDTNKLIKTGVSPENDIILAWAHYDSASLNLFNAQQLNKNSKYALGLAMGIPLSDINGLDEPSDFFPIPIVDISGKISPSDSLNVPNNDILRLCEKDSFYESALHNRMDFKIYELSLEKSKLNLYVSKDQLQSQLDLKLSADYTGINNKENIASSLNNIFDNTRDQNSVYLSLTYKIPIANNAAKGTFIANKSITSQNEITLQEFKRKMFFSIDQSLESFELSKLAYRQIELSIKNYQTALKNEKMKYALGKSTMFDVVGAQETLNSQEILRLGLLRDYAMLLASLNFDIGISAWDSDKAYSIDYSRFFEVR